MLGLYLHIPFCQAICHYCNFNRGLVDEDLKIRYVAALEREIRVAGDGRSADTIFFGGGTPSLLDARQVASLIDACRESYALDPAAEVTLETNPETATAAHLAAFREAGVNRLSVGVQSFDDDQLARLGRIHNAARAAEAVRQARVEGYDNISIDLMCWLPGQSRPSWLESVDRAVELAVDHLSLYLLELYPNAPLKETMGRMAPPTDGRVGPSDPAWTQVDDDEAADMYLEALDRLDAAGYQQYEISNVARPGRQSRHNLKYWTMGHWRGFGCGAHSTVDGERWQNVASTADYVTRVVEGGPIQIGRRRMTGAERAEEVLFTGLRLNAGVDADTLAQQFGLHAWQQYGENLATYVDAGLMWTSGPQFGLTRRGMLVSNEILATFV